MNRRNFLKFLGVASVGATVAYSFPSIIVPKNIVLVDTIVPASQFNLAAIDELVRKEIYPRVIRDVFFKGTPFLAYLKEKHDEGIIISSLPEAVHLIHGDKCVDEVVEEYYSESQAEVNNRIEKEIYLSV